VLVYEGSVKFFSVSCKILYRLLTTNCCFMSEILLSDNKIKEWNILKRETGKYATEAVVVVQYQR
jgi:hypothetical protein